MFSFVGDTVLDPFMGTASTNIAAAKWGRNSIGVEVDNEYFALAEKRLRQKTTSLFSRAAVTRGVVARSPNLGTRPDSGLSGLAGVAGDVRSDRWRRMPPPVFRPITSGLESG